MKKVIREGYRTKSGIESRISRKKEEMGK